MKAQICRYLLLLTAVGVCIGCGGGGSGSAPAAAGAPEPAPTTSNAAPTFELLYPAPTGMTSAELVDVLLKTTDAEGDAVERVRVSNGATSVNAVSVGTDLWRASGVPLAAGDNTLEVTVTDVTGAEASVTAANLTSRVVFTTPNAVVFDASRYALYLYDRSQQNILAIDVNDSAVTEVVALTDEEAANIFGPSASMRLDQNNNLLLLTRTGILRIDPTTGARELVFDVTGTPLLSPFSAMNIDQQNNVAYLLSPVQGIWRVDLNQSEAEAELLSVGSGQMTNAFDVVFVDANSTVYALAFDGSLFSYDLSSGIIAEVRTGAIGGSALSMQYDSQTGEILFLTGSGAILGFNITTRVERTVRVAGDLLLLGATGFATTAANFWLASPVTSNVVEVNRDTKATRLLASSSVGAGVVLGAINGAHGTDDGSTLVIHSPPNIVRLDLQTSNRTLEATQPLNFSPVFATLGFTLPGGLDLSGDERFAWHTDFPGDALFRADLQTGVTNVVADATRGNGPRFNSISGIAVSDDGVQVFVSDTSFEENRVHQVDPDTGDRTQIWSQAIFPAGQVLRDILLDEARGRLILDLGPVSISTRSTMTTGATLVALDLSATQETTLAEFPPATGVARGLFPHQGSLTQDGNTAFTIVNVPETGVLAATSLLTDSASESFSRAADPGPVSGQPAVVVAGSDDRVYLLDFSGAVFQVDRTSGARVLISR